MATSAEQTLHEAMEAFNFSGAPVGALRFGQGHINDTFCLHVERGEERFRLLEQALAEDPLGRGTPFFAPVPPCGGRDGQNKYSL